MTTSISQNARDASHWFPFCVGAVGLSLELLPSGLRAFAECPLPSPPAVLAAFDGIANDGLFRVAVARIGKFTAKELP